MIFQDQNRSISYVATIAPFSVTKVYRGCYWTPVNHTDTLAGALLKVCHLFARSTPYFVGVRYAHVWVKEPLVSTVWTSKRFALRFVFDCKPVEIFVETRAFDWKWSTGHVREHAGSSAPDRTTYGTVTVLLSANDRWFSWY